MRPRTKIAGILTLLMISSGFIMRQYHLPGGAMILALGFLVFIFVFSASFLFDKISLETRRNAKISYSMFFISSVILMSFYVLKDLHLPGASGVGFIGVLLFVSYMAFFSRPEEGRKLKIRKDRQLVAILFTDIAGFTKMMGEDEDRTLLALDQNRKIQKKWIRKFRGKWLKELGDGAIAIFYTASEALLCALEIQKEIKTNEDFDVRMGLHISEIVFTDTDAFGDGMNLASRISDQASAGEICFSDGVYQNIRNRENLHIEEIGPTEMKNVDHPLMLYKI